MIFELITPMTIAAKVMRVVVGLKQTVLRDDPSHLVTHVGPQNRCGKRRVVVGCEVVTDIVQQCTDH